MSLEFKIFTLNCWGIAVVSKNRRNRMKAIAAHLANSEYDVVCLQEVWTDRDFYLIKDEVSGVLPYSHYFYSGVTGSGVCVFSKHLIEEAFFHQWSVNGYIHKIHHGDWFGGKGVGMCKLTVNNFSVNVYTTHLHAEYNRNCDEYEPHRILQAYDTAQFILLTSQCADFVILAGDLNAIPGDPAYRVIRSVADLSDAFEYSEVPKEDTYTCESLRNSYTPAKLVKKKIPGQRIDYIMYHTSSRFQGHVKNYTLPLPDRVPSCSYSYSDHEAIESTVEITEKKVKNSRKNDNDLKTVLHDCLLILDRALTNLVTHKICYTIVSILLLCLLIISFGFDAPVGYSIIAHVLRVVLGIVTVFYFLMATIWNKIEKHGILAGKLAIEKSLKSQIDL